MGIFGTDGIRGTSHVGTLDDPLRSFLEERLFSKQLCGEVAYCASLVAAEGSVVIGWDRRPHNQIIADHVADRLNGTRESIFVLGETATPALQYMMLVKDAALGLMITASHNPSDDTGLKVLFQDGRKPTQEEQCLIERHLFCPKDAEVVHSQIEILSHDQYTSSVSDAIVELAEQGLLSRDEVFIDGSGGWLSTWLADFISSAGINCREVSDRRLPINFNCGAGNLSEGWLSWEECKKSQHSLLKSIKPSSNSEILGFSFDGDGDRCFLICSVGTGVLIVGGDGFLRLFSSKCDGKEDAVVALTVESALDVSQIFKGIGSVTLIETGVGDKWLQHALIHKKSGLRVGAEPSGHVILEQKFGSKTGLWGDGVRTMIEFLRMIQGSGPDWIDSVIDKSSITITKSISPSKKELWSPSNQLAVKVMSGISDSLGVNAGELNRVEIEGEDSLLLINTNNGHEWSFSIRNSGTEPKTRVTIRTNDVDSSIPAYMMSQIMTLLEPELKVAVTSS